MGEPVAGGSSLRHVIGTLWHVIGTLWPIYDDLACTLDVEVYQHLTSQATTPPQTASTAQALHHAIRVLRDDLAGQPTEWAAHIHVGS